MEPSTQAEGISRMLASVGGAVLAVGTQVVAAVRPARKPLHPDGEVRAGRIFRHGSAEKTGVAWLDEAGEDDVDVRLSRAIGLPRTLPDIHGLAIRVHGRGTDGGAGDLLLATTGLGRVTRFVLTFGRRPQARPLTTLLPYETESGAVLIAAEGIGAESYELSWAHPSGVWHRFGVLRLSTGPGTDPEISFDPMRRQLAGLRQYPAVRRLREPAYLSARRSRHHPDQHPTTAPADPTPEENHRVH